MARHMTGAASSVQAARPRDLGDLDEAVPASVPMKRHAALALLRSGTIDPLGRLMTASNASYYCALRGQGEAGSDELTVACVYKPARGERPLIDFPDRTLCRREVAAYLVSEASGWDLVPPTIFRDGPAGPGMVQLWIEVDPTIDPLQLIRAGHPALRRMAVFDALVNNADRKVGHLLPTSADHVYGVDHGICFAVEPKLRTVLWGWRGEPISASERRVLERVGVALEGELGHALGELLAPTEIAATYERLQGLLRTGCLPQPDPDRPAIPWPPY
jgi:uncharacterized repeat protein (TIGR03843 family)